MTERNRIIRAWAAYYDLHPRTARQVFDSGRMPAVAPPPQGPYISIRKASKLLNCSPVALRKRLYRLRKNKPALPKLEYRALFIPWPTNTKKNYFQWLRIAGELITPTNGSPCQTPAPTTPQGKRSKSPRGPGVIRISLSALAAAVNAQPGLMHKNLQGWLTRLTPTLADEPVGAPKPPCDPYDVYTPNPSESVGHWLLRLATQNRVGAKPTKNMPPVVENVQLVLRPAKELYFQFDFQAGPPTAQNIFSIRDREGRSASRILVEFAPGEKPLKLKLPRRESGPPVELPGPETIVIEKPADQPDKKNRSNKKGRKVSSFGRQTSEVV